MNKKRPQKYNQGKSSRRGKPGPKKLPVEEEKPYIGPNDINWRTADEVMTRMVATLPFGHPAGIPWSVFNTHGGFNLKYNQPGVMAIDVNVTAGNATDYNSPINLVSRKIYSFVRHANSGSRNYEAVDLTMYFIAVGQVLALLGFLQRALRTISEFSATNRYTPSTLLKGMSIDAADLMANMPQLKYIIAWLGRAIGSLSFPDIPYFHACYEAFKYIYADNTSPKEQYYMLRPRSIGIYDPTLDANGGGVKYQPSGAPDIPQISSTLMTYSNIVDLVKSRMDVLLGDEDIGIISGDILKAFPNGAGLFKPIAFGLDYDLFQHSPEVLQQIHNMTSMNRADFYGYKQLPGGTNTAPYAVHNASGTNNAFSGQRTLTDHLVIDAFSAVPDAKEVVNCTVLNVQSYIIPGSTTGKYQYDNTSFLFDLFFPGGVYICSSTNGAYYGFGSSVSKVLSEAGGSNWTSGQICALTNFDWHPICWSLTNGSGDDLSALGDVQNLNIFTYDVAARIHENSMLNLFAFKEHNFN